MKNLLTGGNIRQPKNAPGYSRRTPRSYPTLSIMNQAVKLYGCNCDACCNMTPLAEKRRKRIEEKTGREK